MGWIYGILLEAVENTFYLYCGLLIAPPSFYMNPTGLAVVTTFGIGVAAKHYGPSSETLRGWFEDVATWVGYPGYAAEKAAKIVAELEKAKALKEQEAHDILEAARIISEAAAALEKKLSETTVMQSEDYIQLFNIYGETGAILGIIYALLLALLLVTPVIVYGVPLAKWVVGAYHRVSAYPEIGPKSNFVVLTLSINPSGGTPDWLLTLLEVLGCIFFSVSTSVTFKELKTLEAADKAAALEKASTKKVSGSNTETTLDIWPDSETFSFLAELDSMSNLRYGLLFIMVLSSLTVYSIILAGWASNSKYAFIGALRSAAQMISYEVSITVILLPVVLLSGSLNLTQIVFSQLITTWYGLPLLPIAIIFLVAMLAETNRTPFDLPEAEAELVAGYNVDYSSLPFAMFFLGEYSNMILMSVLFCLLFLGGWSVVGGGSAFVLVLKAAFLWFFFVLVRASLPRYRYDQLMDIGWKAFLPLASGYLFFVIGVIVFFESAPVVQELYFDHASAQTFSPTKARAFLPQPPL